MSPIGDIQSIGRMIALVFAAPTADIAGTILAIVLMLFVYSMFKD